MDDALLPLCSAYGVETPGVRVDPEALAPGSAAAVEAVLLAQMRDVLERSPRLAPADGTVAAVVDDAATATAAARLDASLAGLPRPAPARPASAILAAVEAQAAEAALAGATLLAPMTQALGRAPRPTPDAAVLDAVLAFAATAAPADEPAVDTPALASLAAAYGLRHTHAADPVETAVLAGAREALSLAPRESPSETAVAAVLAAASAGARAVPAPRSGRTARTGADRAASRRAVPPPRTLEHRLGRWAGATALVGAALIALLVGGPSLFSGLPLVGDATSETAVVPAQAAVAAPEALDLTPADEASETPELAPETFAGATVPTEAVPGAPPARGPQASPAPVASFAEAVVPSRPTVARRAVDAEPTRPTLTAASRPDGARSDLETRAAPTPAASWNETDDLRTIALRVRALRDATRPDAWEAPAEPFGAPAAPVTMSAMPGLQSVRAGAEPARARLRTDSLSTRP